ncbi:L,D-transpeptidase family protein [Sphingomonas sp. TX0543]|uniref:L,D-transpeptidase family protein n=1 Tax=unclassified Sphingomonas TaxID=196159 RepID=UPI0010F703A1|nr:L,D-transpeptidase family protein [Sphingomonas sp. 3P27F8]
MSLLTLFAAVAIAPQPAPAEPRTITVTGRATLDNASVLRAARALKAGDYMWAPQTAPAGPILMVVNLETQRAVVYRNGLPIAITTVSSGKAGHETPTGIFTVLQKEKVHHSNLYNSAPMPFMQRLTWDGVALHAGALPGHAASHGCIRLPPKFAEMLYGATPLGMTVVVTKRESLPAVVPAADVIAAAANGGQAIPGARDFWEPARAPTGPVSIVVSTTDRALFVIRGGRIIGRASVGVNRQIDHPYLYSLQTTEASGARKWTRIALPGQTPDEELQLGDIDMAPAIRAAIESVLVPGATVVVTPDALTDVSSLKDFVIGK